MTRASGTSRRNHPFSDPEGSISYLCSSWGIIFDCTAALPLLPGAVAECDTCGTYSWSSTSGAYEAAITGRFRALAMCFWRLDANDAAGGLQGKTCLVRLLPPIAWHALATEGMRIAPTVICISSRSWRLITMDRYRRARATVGVCAPHHVRRTDGRGVRHGSSDRCRTGDCRC